MRNDHVNVNIPKGLHDIWFGLKSIKIKSYFIRASRILKAVNSTVFRFPDCNKPLQNLLIKTKIKQLRWELLELSTSYWILNVTLLVGSNFKSSLNYLNIP